LTGEPWSEQMLIDFTALQIIENKEIDDRIKAQ